MVDTSAMPHRPVDTPQGTNIFDWVQACGGAGRQRKGQRFKGLGHHGKVVLPVQACGGAGRQGEGGDG